jgi:NAD(P)-dependent dehydrogenase (short-subunit alcohol dehydrogenase family)
MQDKLVALVTGANQGIGLQIAKDLAAQGFVVLVGSRNLQRGETAAKEIGPDAYALQLDVTDQDSISAAAARVRNEFGRLDVLIQNAAISNTRKLPGQSVEAYAQTTRPSNVSLDEMRAVWDTNVFGVLAVYQAMRRRLADYEFGPDFHLPLDLRSRLSCIQNGPQRSDGRHGARVGKGGDQGKRRLPGLHQDEPQWICGKGDCRRRRPRGGARCATWPGQPNRDVHALGKRNDSVVMKH